MPVIATLANQILRKAAEVNELYYRLVLVVSPPEKGDVDEFKKLATQKGLRLVNVNLELSEKMLTMTARQRSLRAASLLGDLIANANNETVLLDNIEILFDPALRLDPLRALQSLSRRQTIVVSWKGWIRGAYLTYAEPDHPEYRRYSTRDLVLIHQDNNLDPST